MSLIFKHGKEAISQEFNYKHLLKQARDTILYISNEIHILQGWCYKFVTVVLQNQNSGFAGRLLVATANKQFE